ncbi:MAG: diguanylate cyclase [Clostridia bacterium]|nr:diguanylate cyclase [Clostridia bacterium]
MDKVNIYKHLLTSAEKLVPLGWYQWHIKENRILFSEAFCASIGVESEMAMEDFEMFLSEEGKKLLHETLEQIIINKHMETLSLKIKDKSNRIHWISLNGITISNMKKEPEKIVGTILDITKKIEREKEIDSEVNFYEALMATLENPIFYKNVDGIYTYCNQAFCDFFEKDYNDIIGQSIDLFINSGDLIHNKSMDDHLIEHKEKVVYETIIRRSNGSVRNVLINKTLHQSGTGEILGVVGLIYDITDRKRNESLIQKQIHIKDVIIDITQNIQEFNTEEELYCALIEQLLLVFENAHSGSVLNVTEKNTLIIEASCNYDKVITKDFEIPLNKSFVYHHTNGNIVKPGILNEIDKMMNEYDIPERIKNDDDDVLRSNLYIPMLINNKLKKIISLDSNKPFNFTTFDLTIAEYIQQQINIIHKLFQLYQETIQLSRYDNLTGVMNRGYFEAIVEDRLEIALRNHHSFSIVMFDLDNLKYVNDTYGHNMGDKYIIRFTELLQQFFRSSDQIGRLGGDEFCCSFIDSDIRNIILKIEQIRLIFKNQPFGTYDHEFDGRFSYGVASLPHDGFTIYDLLKKADFDMYVDKKQYKDTVSE